MIRRRASASVWVSDWIVRSRRALLCGAMVVLAGGFAGGVYAKPQAAANELDGVAIVLVKDFMPIRNRGPLVHDVTFERYVPLVDSEQVVLGRWVSAMMSPPRADGAAGANDGDDHANAVGVPVWVASIAADAQSNLIHTFKLPSVPAWGRLTVTVTTLVARRERQQPPRDAKFPILKLEQYPEHVRPFLNSTAMVAADHPAIVEQAVKIRGETDDALEAARAVADLMRTKTYQMQGEPDFAMPTAALVLKHGGSCCGSAVCAAAILRASGVPAQVTYCPAGYVHGVLRFYLDGYGWMRMDATSSVGKLPIVQEAADRGLVRLFDMPIEMESLDYAYAWPYYHNDSSGQYRFMSKGQPVAALRFEAHDEQQARREGRVAGHVQQPFPHLEPGSWHTVLMVEDWPIADAAWDELAAASRAALSEPGNLGLFEKVAANLKLIAGGDEDVSARYVEQAAAFGAIE